MTNPDDDFERAIAMHDRQLAERQLTVWVGAEPTFTDRQSQQPEWLNQALGETKQARAGGLLAQLAGGTGALVLRSVGRQYREEPRPRWNFGLYARRDGLSLWQGPPDPLLGTETVPGEAVDGLQDALVGLLREQGWQAVGFSIADDSLPLRILCSPEQELSDHDPAKDARFAESSLHERPTPMDGLVDSLAEQGLLLIKLGHSDNAPCIELPQFGRVSTFVDFVNLVERACRQVGLAQLVWQGHPPPVDERIAWTTVTPDPAVVEVNLAPAASISEFFTQMGAVFQAAHAEGLSPERFQYNGQVGDSGGGGQFTLGGPQPMTSPFIVAPRTLPRLIRYLVRHPALSYWFAPVYVGSFSQSPRPDEGVRDSFVELELALRRLAEHQAPSPEFIWRSLNNFLVDSSGNSHRSELNIEKLWNPYLPQRGCLGLVEFRAFRMTPTPHKAAAIAALLRSLTAMLTERNMVDGLKDWGSELHQRFALPFYLRQDLSQVLADLQAAGLGLEQALARQLLEDPDRELAQAELDGCRFSLEQAVEFWPLIGDTAMQASEDSRLVDASTQRLQLSLRALDGAEERLADWSLWIEGCRLPLRDERDGAGALRLFGVRYRSFEPLQGLHPGLAARQSLPLQLWNARTQRGLRLTWHEWRPDSAPYDGLPSGREQAQQRRQERLVIEPIDDFDESLERGLPAGALSDYCLDLRYL